MRDYRVEKLARVLVDYSVEAGEGDQVVLSGGSAAETLIKAVYARLLEVGATPVPLVGLPGMQELFFEHAGDHHYEKTPPITRTIYEEADAFISIMAPTNTRALANVDPAKQQALGKRDQQLREIVMKKDRWVLTLFPTEALAQESDMGLEEYEKFVFSAMALDKDDPAKFWQEKSDEQAKLKERLEEAREIQISRPRDRPHAFSGRAYFRKLRRQEEHAVRRGFHRAGRGLGERHGLLRRPERGRRPGGLRRAVPL